MGRIILSLTLCLALLVTVVGHAVAAHPGHAGTDVGAAAMDRATEAVQKSHNCDSPCKTNDVVADCCGMTVAHCTGTIVGTLNIVALIHSTSPARFFAGNLPPIGSSTSFDPPPPKS